MFRTVEIFVVISQSQTPSVQRVALVTGANRGIGLEVCRLLSERGTSVILSARDIEKGERAAGELQKKSLSKVSFVQLDVTDSASSLCSPTSRDFNREF